MSYKLIGLLVSLCLVFAAIVWGFAQPSRSLLWKELHDAEAALQTNPTDETSKELERLIQQLVELDEIIVLEVTFPESITTQEMLRRQSEFCSRFPDAFVRTYGHHEKETGGEVVVSCTVQIEKPFSTDIERYLLKK